MGSHHKPPKAPGALPPAPVAPLMPLFQPAAGTNPSTARAAVAIGSGAPGLGVPGNVAKYKTALGG